MQSHDQLKLTDTEQLPPEVASNPEFTPEQEQEIDHFVDHGFNYFEAKMKAGAIAVEQVTGRERNPDALPPETQRPQSSPKTSRSTSSRTPKKPKKATTSWEKAAADRAWPAHIKRWEHQ